MAGGYNHTVATTSDGELYAWGYNGYGQLGLGDTSNRSYPTRVGSGTDWLDVDTADYTAMALRGDGTLWGGEAFVGRPGHWQRRASLRSFRLPGGDKAGRSPWRSAAALCWEAGMECPVPVPDPIVRAAWERGINAPRSSAAGRVFDALSAHARHDELESDGDVPTYDAVVHFDIRPGDVFLWPVDMGWIAGPLVLCAETDRRSRPPRRSGSNPSA